MPESLSFADLADLQYELDQGSAHWDKLMEKDTLQALVSMAVERVSGLAGSSPAAEADTIKQASAAGVGCQCGPVQAASGPAIQAPDEGSNAPETPQGVARRSPSRGITDSQGPRPEHSHTSPAAEAETQKLETCPACGGRSPGALSLCCVERRGAGGVSDSSEAVTRNETRAAACACVLPFNGTGADWDESKCPIHGPGSSVTGEAPDG